MCSSLKIKTSTEKEKEPYKKYRNDHDPKDTSPENGGSQWIRHVRHLLTITMSCSIIWYWKLGCICSYLNSLIFNILFQPFSLSGRKDTLLHEDVDQSEG